MCYTSRAHYASALHNVQMKQTLLTPIRSDAHPKDSDAKRWWDMETRDSPKTIQSVGRAFQVLFSFSLEHPRWRMSELSESLGLHPSTTSRLLTTMKEMGVVKKDPVTQQYELSLGILQLSRVVLSQLDLVKITLPIMSALVERCRESVFLVVLDGLETVTIAQVAAPRVFSPSPYHVGHRYQASAVSGGKLLLAHGPQCVVDQLIEEGLTAYRAHDHVSATTLGGA